MPKKGQMHAQLNARLSGSTSDREKIVESEYEKAILVCSPGAGFTHPYKMDGYIERKLPGIEDKLRLGMEFKYDKDMTNSVEVAKIIVQVLNYMKRFEADGKKLPNVILIGDVNECIVFHSNDIIDYLDEPGVDWNCAASAAAVNNMPLVMKIANDGRKQFVYTVDENFSFKLDVWPDIVALTKNTKRYIHVTEHNCARIYDYFCERVLTDKTLAANDKVEVFIGVISDKDNYYKHPSKKGTVVANGREVRVKNDEFDKFFGHFDRTYTPAERAVFQKISDRLIEDNNRRAKGEFYTPTPFVDRAHRMIESVLGEDWKEKYVVWDSCWGTGNLTRDYRFSEPYFSTLEQAELNIGASNNPSATKFRFDFLNDKIERGKVPGGLMDALEQNKPIVFFINPPYGRPSKRNTGKGKGGIATGSTKSKVRDLMHKDGMGAGAENLQHQFLYRICKLKEHYGLTDVHIALFSNPVYLTGAKQKDFLEYFCSNFEFINGCMFRANNFADVSSVWGIAFNIWKAGETSNMNEFHHEVIGMVDGSIQPVEPFMKTLYNVNGGVKASDWIREPVKGTKKVDAPHQSSAIKITDNGKAQTRSGYIGYMVSNGNAVSKNATDVFMLSSLYSYGLGCTVLESNFTRCTSLFAARRLVNDNWVDHMDEYMVPDTSNSEWQEFENDSVIYSLFESKSNQSSLRNVAYRGKTWTIKNEFFWISNKDMEDLANKEGNTVCYSDAHGDKDRFVTNYIANLSLSPEAQAVLDKATELVKNSFKYRAAFDQTNPEYQINNWDCGWYQVKALLKMYDPKGLEEFKELYEKLAAKMLPMVYTLGFLKK